MSRINAEEANRLWAQINKPENWRDAQNIPIAGSKTLERLRGNSRVTEWVNAMTNYNSFVEKCNKYRSNSVSQGMTNGGANDVAAGNIAD